MSSSSPSSSTSHRPRIVPLLWASLGIVGIVVLVAPLAAEGAVSGTGTTTSGQAVTGPGAPAGVDLHGDGAAEGVGPRVGVHQALGYYEGGWSQLNSRSDSDGSSEYLNSTGSASLTFVGDSVRWITRTTPNSGIADVYLDDRLVASVDRYSQTTEYQQNVFERAGLDYGEHTIAIRWSGRKNPASADRNLVIDAIVVPDTRAPAAPTSVVARADGADVLVSWSPVDDWNLQGYRIYGGRAGEPMRLIGMTSADETAFRGLGLPSSSDLRYSVTAVDGWRNESPASSVAHYRSGQTPSGSNRYERCPQATVTVSTTKALSAAIKSSTPGTVIRLAPGVYPGQLDITAKGTAARPIWICAPRSAVIDGGGLSVKSPINVSFSSHLIVTGMTARNALKGVTVRASDHVTISDLLVEQIGYEGIHLRSHTTDSTVVGNTVRATGRLDPFYGEGVYVGSSQTNWCALTDCLPDSSDRNAVVGNTIGQTGSDLIEAKEGTTGGYIADNILDGTDGMARTESWIMMTGNDWSVVGNDGTKSSLHGFRVNGATAGWGLRSLWADNVGRVDAAGFGFKLWEPDGDGTSGTVIACSNRITGAASGYATVACSN